MIEAGQTGNLLADRAELASREQLHDYLAHTVCDPTAIQELKEYLTGSFDRFLTTLEFLPQAPGRVLELGATPYFMTMLIQRFRPDYRLELANFFGEDLADSSVLHDCVVENSKYQEQHTLHYRQFNVERQPFPFPDAALDGILFCEILEHLTRDPVAALLECHRVLKAEGWLLVTTPNFARFDNIIKLWMGQNPSDQYSGYGPYGRHNREYTLSELERLLTDIGFQIRRIEARSIHQPVPRSWMHAVLPVLRPAWRHQEHLFCLAHKSRPLANHGRPGWLYRNLPSKPSELELWNKETSPEMATKKLRISMINLNLVAEDAIGTCIINQARLFHRRGDDVRIHILHAPVGVPADVEALTSVVSLRDLISGQDEYFNSSDLYIFHYPSRHELMESIRGIDRGTVIFYYHNVTPPELWGSETDRDLLVQGIEGKVLAHYADLCITDSPYNKQDLVDSVGYDPDRIHVVPFAVPLDCFAPGEKDPALVERYGLAGEKVLLFVGRMAGNKRIDLVIEALAQIQKLMPNTKLLLVGDKDSAPAYRQIVAAAQLQASELGVADSIVWTGPVRRSELPTYFRLADAYISASLHEGFGVPLIEAMASGIPIVAGRAGAIPWVLGDAGLLCEPNDASSLAEKALSILEDADLHQTFVQLGLERAQVFSLERHEREVVRIVDQAITYSLPAAVTEPGTGQGPEAMPQPSISRARDEIVLAVIANELAAQSDIAMRDYHVRSRLPLVGPLIAWIRRNLTSHLREPYLDPIIERQVEVNYRIAEYFRRVASALESASRQRAELEARVEVLEAQVNALTEPSHPDESQGERAA